MTRHDVTLMVLKNALAGDGLAIGVPVAIYGRRFATIVVGNAPIQPAFPITFAASSAMIAVALMAACAPARRAARLNPMEALRHS